MKGYYLFLTRGIRDVLTREQYRHDLLPNKITYKLLKYFINLSDVAYKTLYKTSLI